LQLDLFMYVVIGNPIEFSKSPLIHSMFGQATGIAIDYGRLLGELGQFAPTVDAFRARGGKGMNITTPFKLDAFAYATHLSERAKLAGAINCMKFEGDVVHGENFDGVGLLRDVVHNLKCPLKDQRVLILGAGGATRGALQPFLAEKPGQLVIANRDVAKAQALAQDMAAWGPLRACSYADLAGQAFDVIVNATSASLRAELPPVPNSVFAPGCLAYELAYGKGLTPFLKQAQSAGVTRLHDGVGMLAEQAAEAFEWWTGTRPNTAAVIAHLTVPLT
jgi:shikimate dehydrogenase